MPFIGTCDERPFDIPAISLVLDSGLVAQSAERVAVNHKVRGSRPLGTEVCSNNNVTLLHYNRCRLVTILRTIKYVSNGPNILS
jgi:hypothetical protein